eukprot:36686_1
MEKAEEMAQKLKMEWSTKLEASKAVFEPSIYTGQQNNIQRTAIPDSYAGIVNPGTQDGRISGIVTGSIPGRTVASAQSLGAPGQYAAYDLLAAVESIPNPYERNSVQAQELSAVKSESLQPNMLPFKRRRMDTATGSQPSRLIGIPSQPSNALTNPPPPPMLHPQIQPSQFIPGAPTQITSAPGTQFTSVPPQMTSSGAPIQQMSVSSYSAAPSQISYAAAHPSSFGLVPVPSGQVAGIPPAHSGQVAGIPPVSELSGVPESASLNHLDSEELCSADDDSDVEDADLETEDIILCQYDKVMRKKDTWKIKFCDGIMKLDGKDHAFRKATGIFVWS